MGPFAGAWCNKMERYHVNHPDDFDTNIDSLGPCTIPSPLSYKRFTKDDDLLLYDLDVESVRRQLTGNTPVRTFERAGPREKIYFDPVNVKAAIVTCGGLCPGINDVIRAIVNELHYIYGVRRIKGVRYGYAGLNPANSLPMVDLTPESVTRIHEEGGTVLGSSRGKQPVDVMVDTLEREEIRILFLIGGDGTLRGANEIYEEIKRRNLKISVVGIPKTIDNDIHLVSRTFGFDTAVSTAVESIRCAHVEATNHINGVGIVKLMGRNSGFVAASAALARPEANYVLIPEIPFDLDGPKGLLEVLTKRLSRRGHSLIVVAEGAGQEHFDGESMGTDESGNIKFGDIGLLLKKRITAHLEKQEIQFTVKYIDPSYIIRSVPANPNDSIFCVFLGQHAVHAGMAGKTGLLIGSWNSLFVHLPIHSANARRKQVDPDGILWLSVLETTGQPECMMNDPSRCKKKVEADEPQGARMVLTPSIPQEEKSIEPVEQDKDPANYQFFKK